jgi:hypothetical protein
LGIKISKQKISYILKNPVYIGKIKTIFFDEFIQGIHKPLIDKITFYKEQNLLNKNYKQVYKSDFNKDFPLRKFLKCPLCNRNLAGSWSKGRNKKYPYYHCVNKGCSYKPIRREIANNLFT